MLANFSNPPFLKFDGNQPLFYFIVMSINLNALNLGLSFSSKYPSNITSISSKINAHSQTITGQSFHQLSKSSVPITLLLHSSVIDYKPQPEVVSCLHWQMIILNTLCRFQVILGFYLFWINVFQTWIKLSNLCHKTWWTKSNLQCCNSMMVTVSIAVVH